MKGSVLWSVALCGWLAGGAASAQGLYDMASDADGFALPQPGEDFVFPADHGAHPDFRLEWWYVTAVLTGADGASYGAQWTLFRAALRPGGGAGWADPQVWFAHAAVTTPDAHLVAERLARGGIGQAGVQPEPFRAWIDEWQMAGPTLSQVEVNAAGKDFAYSLALEAGGPFVPQGAGGYSVKSEAGQASRYYSQPFYEVTGTLVLPEGEVAVSGQAWLDREWSSAPLTEAQTGWDWFSLHLDSGEKLMGYRLRSADGSAYAPATWILPDGTPVPYEDGALQAEPLETAEVSGRELPVAWRLRLPDRGLDVEVRALNEAAWMDTAFPYWEGPVAVSGSHSGRGYLEMTGYEE